MDASERGGGSTATRERILDAARDLAVDEGFSGFTVEKVAERAGVSRMTVYYQFGAKQALLQALLDHLAARGRMDRLGEAFQEPDALEGLDRFIRTFCGFWSSDRVGLRRLRAWASVEVQGEDGALERDAWRRKGLETLVGRMRAERGVPAEEAVAGVVDVLQVLTSFESYDSLAGSEGKPDEVAALLQRTARAVLGVEEDPAG